MLHFRMFLLSLLLLAAGLSRPCQAKFIPTYDLTTNCFRSTDVIEARLTRHHLPGQEEWNDTFTATVAVPLEGRFHAGDQISGLDLTLYDPANTGQQCILFLAPNTLDFPARSHAAPLRVVDMLIVDHQGRVRRYFQWGNPGGLAAQGYRLVPIAPPSHVKITRVHGTLEYSYQENDGYVEDDSAEQRYPALAEERALIMTKWAAAKKLQAPPYQVLHDTER